MSPLSDDLCKAGGRRSIPPSHQLKTSLLMAFRTLRSEPQFREHTRAKVLFKWLCM